MPTASTDTAPLAALALGSEVPADEFAFHVHSVFAAALNMRLEGRRFVVTLLGAGAEDYPQGIRLAAPERFDAWPVRPGDRGRCTGGRLVFASGPQVDLAGAARAVRGAPARIEPGSGTWQATWAACARDLEARQEGAGTPLRLAALLGDRTPAGALAARLAAAARELGECIRTGNADSADRASARIIGLGTGLTPAGDDLLVGLLAALWCTDMEGGADRRFLAGWSAKLAARFETTNVISATFLECALAGAFCGPLAELARTIAAGGAEGVRGEVNEAMGRLCALGHSSGMDTATGFLFGLSLRTGTEMRRYAPSI